MYKWDFQLVSGKSSSQGRIRITIGDNRIRFFYAEVVREGFNHSLHPQVALISIIGLKILMASDLEIFQDQFIKTAVVVLKGVNQRNFELPAQGFCQYCMFNELGACSNN